MRRLMLLCSTAMLVASVSAHAAPKMLTSECHESVNADGQNIRSCLAPGEAPVNQKAPTALSPTPPQSVPEQPSGMPPPLAAQPIPQSAPQQAATPEVVPPVALALPPAYPPLIHQYGPPVLESYPVPSQDNRVRQQFRFSIGGLSIVTPPIVVGSRNPTCQVQCWNRGGYRDCRQYCW